MKEKKFVWGLILSFIILLGILPAQETNAEEGGPAIVDEIRLSIDEPKAGALITNECTSAEPDKYSASVGWMDMTGDEQFPQEGSTFIQGHTYQLQANIIMAEGYTLSIPNTKVYANDMQLEIVGSDSVTFVYWCTAEIPSQTGGPVELIDSAHLRINVPKPGEMPDLNPTADEEAIGISIVDWGYSGVFEPETTYKVMLEIFPKPGYQFSPNIYVSINSTLVDYTINKEDPLKLSVEYSFTTLTDKTIYNVAISDIQEPKAGKFTTHMCKCTNDGEHYHVHSVKWCREMSYNVIEFFAPDANYSREIVLEADEGYTFGPYEDINFTINGEPSKECFVRNDGKELVYLYYIRIKEPIAGTWRCDNTGWWYQYSDGSYENDGLLKIGDHVFYFKKDGYIATGWVYEDGKWFFFDDHGYMAEEWNKIGGDWYYFTIPEGMMLKDTEVNGYYLDESGKWIPDKWVYSETAGKYWYSYSYGGYPHDTTKRIGDKIYHFDKDGYMVTGWYFDESLEKWYYFDESGAMVMSGWYWIDGECYYFYEGNGSMAADTDIDGHYVNSSGVMARDRWIQDQKGWWYSLLDGGYPKSELKDIDGQRYYFDENGYIVSGWKNIEDVWYYFNESGFMMKNEWKWIGNSCYYFYEDGKMASNEWIDDSYVNVSGAWVKGEWHQNNAGWWYRYGDGSYPAGKFKMIDGQTYSFNAYGYIETGWKYDQENWYYFNESGHMAVNSWVYINGKYYYADENGTAVMNTWRSINGQSYYFYSDGHMASDQWVDGFYVDASGKWIPGK